MSAEISDRAIHFAVQRHKAAYGDEITIARLRQIAAGIEYFRGIENETRRETARDDRG